MEVSLDDRGSGQRAVAVDDVPAAEEQRPCLDRQPASPWLQAALAVAQGEFVEAADVFGRIGDVTDEAFYRLCAAEQLVEQGRRAEADEELGRALAFYRGVRATRYIRKGEALLAASA